MKYIKTLFNLKPISYQNIHNLINRIHQTSLTIEDHISYQGHHYVIKNNNTYAYHIEDTSIYEYIYNEDKHQFYIMIDKRDDQFISIIDELIDMQYIDDSSLLYPSHHAFNLHDVDLESYEHDLPIIYLNEQLNDEDFICELTQKVKSMAYVVYGNDNINKSMIIFKHKEKLLFSPFHKENYSSLIERLFTKVQNYMCRYEYGNAYSVSELYKKAINEMIEKTKDHESVIELTLEEKLLNLEIEKEDYLEKIYKLQNEVLLLESQIEDYKKLLNQSENTPLLFKGKEKEFYEDEQKDIILYLVRKRLETSTDPDTKILLQSITDDNPSLNIRDKKIEEFARLLISSKKMNSRLIEDLRQNDLTLERHTSNHYFFSFYNDSRYLIDIASSPSDMNWSRQAYRAIKKFCF